MSDLSHLRVEATPSSLPYTSTQAGRGEFRLPPRDRAPHAQKLLVDITQARAAIDAVRPQITAAPVVDGYALAVESEAGFVLRLKSLDRQRDQMELLSVKNEGTTQVASVFVRRDRLVTFARLVEKYRDEDTQRGNPKNQKLVESIAAIRMLALRDLWQEADLAFPEPDQPMWWEVWIRTGDSTPDKAYLDFVDLALSRHIDVSSHFVRFPERVVLLAWATARQLGESLDLLNYIAELRKAKEAVTPYLNFPARDQRLLVNDVLGRLQVPSGDAPAVCLLDTGVNREHPLIEPILAATDTQAVDPAWGVADTDPDQHGTGMAGVAIYRCLTDAFTSTGAIEVRHRLESVKLLPPPPQANSPEVYGWVTQEAVSRAEIQAPERNRAICMAVTADERDRGLPSSWSAAIDQMCAGELDEQPKLMFLAAGNYDAVVQNPGYVYPNWNQQHAPTQDPAQSWNAVTVGAYTEKFMIQDREFRGWHPIAPAGDLTPSSRTSLAWSSPNYDWPIKPDIVMEGGNYVTDGRNCSCCPDLALLTTALHSSGRLFSFMGDTSAATAAAARLAAIIWSYYPNLRPETVRALIIHSADWTPAMLDRCPGQLKEDVHRRVRCFGYGVPSLQRALWSAENAATLIYEGALQPFHRDGGEYKSKEMHLHHIPWPTQVLQDLGPVPVKMRVTLSYFIEPSPGRRGWQTKHRFQSHALRFDVISPLETEQQFRQRLSRAMWEDENERPQNIPETRNWVIGSKGRTRGSIHSDWWTGTAAELAACATLAVYPVTGWWKERPHLGRWNKSANYSLVVSIEAPDQQIDLYTPIVNQTTVSTELET